jgi:UDP-N-acetylmuramate dehydrogenase
MSLVVQKKIDLKSYTTMGVHSIAENFIEVSTIEELIEALKWAKEYEFPTFILGGGSNVVMPEHLQGLVIANRIMGRQVDHLKNDKVLIRVGGGEGWHSMVSWTVENQWYGLENLALIPGLVGAAPIQNIGAYGVEVKDAILRVQYLDKQSLTTHWISKEECLFGYRDSIFKQQLREKVIIVAVEFELQKKGEIKAEYESLKAYLEDKSIVNPTQKEVFDAVVAVRKSRLPDPNVLGNCGSFFKNPVVRAETFESLKKENPEIKAYPLGNGLFKLAAGWLIDQAVGKGYRKGVMGTYEHQALVVVHHGGGSSRDVQAFVEEIRLKVLQKFHLELEAEVQLV